MGTSCSPTCIDNPERWFISFKKARRAVYVFLRAVLIAQPFIAHEAKNNEADAFHTILYRVFEEYQEMSSRMQALHREGPTASNGGTVSAHSFAA